MLWDWYSALCVFTGRNCTLKSGWYYSVELFTDFYGYIKEKTVFEILAFRDWFTTGCSNFVNATLEESSFLHECFY